ncbi:MAG TPA: hypothetical protein VKA08_07555, partial [Balneolales bacterium]|nr:hypothetical protein [Balneolales bacterium]
RWNSDSRSIDQPLGKCRNSYNNQGSGYVINFQSMDLYAERNICGDKNIITIVPTGKIKPAGFQKNLRSLFTVTSPHVTPKIRGKLAT